MENLPLLPEFIQSTSGPQDTAILSAPLDSAAIKWSYTNGA